MKDYIKEYENWCFDEYFEEEDRKELLGLKGQQEEIQDRFYKDLEFGTGGLRGIIGAGTNRINIYTVRKATQGLANYILKQEKEEKSVAIAFDSRRMSSEFAMEAALCLAGNGIKVYLFEELRPTPELSFAVRHLGCIAGIVITASHNPPEYNGYKVYWEDGAQITYPKDVEIIAEVNKVNDYKTVKIIDKNEALDSGLLIFIGNEIDSLYMQALKRLVINPDLVEQVGKKLKIVYTPIHGTGNVPVRRILKELGFEHVYVVPEQEMPDENFSTVKYPNPEDKEVFKLALELAKKVDADIILATDPDADRLGVYAKDSKTGQFKAFTGNMSGALICEYLFSQKREKGRLSSKGALVKTIVTTNMADAIAKRYGATLIETLTGFKYIGEQIKLFEQNKKYEFEFGFEESYGCLLGTHARDKDAVVAVMTLCEAAAYYKNLGITLWDQMIRMYETYGYFREDLHTKTFKGAEGAVQIQSLLDSLRENPLKEVGGYQVKSISDFLTGEKKYLGDGKAEKIKLLKSNVLYYELENDAWFCVRPSGTEPKIKYYFGVNGFGFEDSEKKLEQLKQGVLSLGE
ncbi:phospho-sugar mutase [Anaerosacchariphilus polymeriproducens]|uniref:Phosphoglucomutase n=1 Tax=Anaerosacchariphilus polymeriproducens TaxID=1812858 RepID=A0A371AWZ3_9FIRM|nr:phospho-sugar mutase [Anaerosacchariphilus polymeriproducens]RDU24061.1 phospho-sugar mutase [Anaerosacchariphilus polymeriproducens]